MTDNRTFPIIHLYGPFSPHEEQIIACNDAGLKLLKQLIGNGTGQVDPFTDDGEGFHLHLIVTEETSKLPSPYTDETTAYMPSDWTWLINQIRARYGLKPMPEETNA